MPSLVPRKALSARECTFAYVSDVRPLLFSDFAARKGAGVKLLMQLRSRLGSVAGLEQMLGGTPATTERSEPARSLRMKTASSRSYMFGAVVPSALAATCRVSRLACASTCYGNASAHGASCYVMSRRSGYSFSKLPRHTAYVRHLS